MDAVTGFLRGAGVPSHLVHTERFVVQQGEGRAKGRVHRVHLIRRDVVLMVQDSQTILEAALSAGVPLASSCGMGACGACRVRVRSGEVEMDEPNCLTHKERSRGFRLMCVGRPASDLEIDV
jgi:ferredoxin